MSAPLSAKVTLNGRPLYFDVNPKNVNNSVLVPLRVIFESMGAAVSWDDATETITGTKDGREIVLRLNERSATVDGAEVELQEAAARIEGRIFVPARFIAESLGAEVTWNQESKTVAIDNHSSAADKFYYFIYNSSKVTNDDLAAIKLYINKFTGTYNVLLDISSYPSAPQIYAKG